MSYTLRPATADERAAAVGPWTTLLAPSRPRGEDGQRAVDPDAGTPLTRLGRVSVARAWLVAAMRAEVERVLLGPEPCKLLVADHPDAPGLALGWVAFEPSTVLALHVGVDSRRAWVGRTLLAHALQLLGPDVRCAALTEAGRRLLVHVRGSMRGAVAA